MYIFGLPLNLKFLKTSFSALALVAIITAFSYIAFTYGDNSSALADETQAAYILPNTTVVELPPSSNNGEYQLYVHVPNACQTKDFACSVAYMLDAEYSFALSVQIVTHMSDRASIEPVISVGISNKDKNHYRLFRTRDYTPYYVAEGGYGPTYQAHSGGGPNFLKVIQEEIIPYVEKHFHAKPEGRTLVGHSFGGLFASYVWTQAPETFDNFVIVSPSLWYADERVLTDAANACQSGGGAASKIFLAVGAKEERSTPAHAMVSELKHFKKILDDCTGRRVDVTLRVFEDETHNSIFPAALSTGLRTHFQ